MADTGRPSEYDPVIAAYFCELIATGKQGIRRLCDQNDSLPEPQTLYRWMSQHPEFREQYAHAKEEQLQLLEDEILEIADDSTNDYVTVTKKNGDEYEVLNKEAVMRSNLRIESRKWLMGKLKPKKYGEKNTTEHTGADGGPIQCITKSILE
jgi:hypothetical protein